MVPQHVLQPVVRNAAAEMVHVVHADVGREPAQYARQIVMGAASQRGFVQRPSRGLGPERVLELMLYIKQPDAGSGSTWTARNGLTPTSQIIARTISTMATFVAIVLSQDRKLLRIALNGGSRCCTRKR